MRPHGSRDRAPIPSEPDPARGSPALGAGGVWVAAAAAAAGVGSAYWDDSWHTTLGRDSTFIPPHLLLYASILTVGVVIAGWGWRRLAATRSVAAVFRTPGFALAVAAAVATAAAAPADAFWHTAFGRDAVLWSPPHLLSVIGTLCVLIGLLTGTDRHVPAPPRIALAAGVLGAALIIVMEYDTDVPQFTETLYLPLLLATTLGAAWVITTLVPGRTRLVLVVAVYLVFRVVLWVLLTSAGWLAPDLPVAVAGLFLLALPVPRWRWPVAALAVTTLQLLASGTGLVKLSRTQQDGLMRDQRAEQLGYREEYALSPKRLTCDASARCGTLSVSTVQLALAIASEGAHVSKTIRERSRRMISVVAASLLAVGLLSVPTAASAYTTTGCKWSTGNLNINLSSTNGTMRTALYSALNNYTLGTDTNLTGVTTSGPSFTAANNNYGATGWAGYNNWNCAFGVTSSSLARVNDYYNANLASNEGRIRVIWLHEIGHGLGLDHVTTVARVMYTPTSSAYNAGVRNLTSDEINGINALY